MKLLKSVTILLQSLQLESMPIETRTLEADMVIHDNVRTMCDKSLLSADFTCADIDDFSTCTRQCPGDSSMIEKRRCECYKLVFGIMLVYS